MMLSDGLLRVAAAAAVHILAGPGEIVVVIRNLPTPPQPRQNRNTRWGTGRNAEKALDYNAWRGPLRDLLRIRMDEAGIKRLKGSIEASLQFEMTLPANDPGPDLDSLCKSALDVVRGILIPDDRHVVRLVAAKLHGREEARWTFREVP